jgi:hypothetical protein
MPGIRFPDLEVAIRRTRAWHWAHVFAAERRRRRNFVLMTTLALLQVLTTSFQLSNLSQQPWAYWTATAMSALSGLMVGAIARLRDAPTAALHQAAARQYIKISRNAQKLNVAPDTDEFAALTAIYDAMGEVEDDANLPAPPHDVLRQVHLVENGEPPPPARTLTTSSNATDPVLVNTATSALVDITQDITQENHDTPRSASERVSDQVSRWVHGNKSRGHRRMFV